MREYVSDVVQILVFDFQDFAEILRYIKRPKTQLFFLISEPENYMPELPSYLEKFAIVENIGQAKVGNTHIIIFIK